MEDRFKLRGWLVKDKQMVGIREISLNESRAWRADMGIHSGLDIPDDIIPMQCTGMKDKNGTLVYEGDRLQQMPSTGTGVVIWQYSGFWFRWDDGVTSYNPFADFPNNYTIIGNIYEDEEEPEVLVIDAETKAKLKEFEELLRSIL